MFSINPDIRCCRLEITFFIENEILKYGRFP